MTIPIDSAEAAELRERETSDEQDDRPTYPLADDQHDARCRGGWLGEDADGRPVVCHRCRPHLLAAPCWTCSATQDACAHQQARRLGPCCDACDHHRRTHPTTRST